MKRYVIESKQDDLSRSIVLRLRREIDEFMIYD